MKMIKLSLAITMMHAAVVQAMDARVSQEGESEHIQTTNALVMIESRDLPYAADVVRNFVEEVPWDVIVYHGSGNRHTFADSPVLQDVQGLVLRNLGMYNISRGDYNDLLMSRTFWEELEEYEHILIFQTDTIACSRKGEDRGIEDFFSYDYVGASECYDEDH
eukprot:g641.t1